MTDKVVKEMKHARDTSVALVTFFAHGTTEVDAAHLQQVVEFGISCLGLSGPMMQQRKWHH